MFRGQFIALNAYTRNEQRSKINNPSFHLMQLEQILKEEIKSKVQRR